MFSRRECFLLGAAAVDSVVVALSAVAAGNDGCLNVDAACAVAGGAA